MQICQKKRDSKSVQSNLSASFQDLRKDQDFSDVTLTCDGDTRVEAHRVILAGSSKFFSKVSAPEPDVSAGAPPKFR